MPANARRRPKRETVDLAQFPNLVVIYLGMRVNTWTGVKTLLGFGPKIERSVVAKPDGLLLHENLLYSLRHLGMRQYWRDFDALEAWSRSEPHVNWWQSFLRDSRGAGFWHEAYSRRGGMEAVYVDMNIRTGFSAFAPVHEAKGAMFSARKRAGLAGETALKAAVSESEFYSS